MNTTEHLLSVLGEEGSEIAKETSKANRFGLDDRHSKYEPPVIRIVNELNDLLGVVELLVLNGILPKNWKQRHRIVAKKRKVLKYMDHARKQGTLI